MAVVILVLIAVIVGLEQLRFDLLTVMNDSSEVRKVKIEMKKDLIIRAGNTEQGKRQLTNEYLFFLFFLLAIGIL